MAASQLEIRYNLLRTVSSYVNSKQPHLCKKVVLLVSQLGLAAEGDSRLSREESDVLSGGVDAFCDKVKDALARKNADEEKVLGIAQLSWLISNSCESRVAHSSQQWCSVLLDIVKQDHGSSLALSACGLLSQLFKRLQAMAWVQGVRKLVAPLASRVLQAMTKNLAIHGKETISWLAHGRVIVSIVKSFPVHHQHMEIATEALIPRLVMETASDKQRLLSSEFLAAVIASSKDRRQWSAVVRQLLLLSHQLLDHILGEWEVDTWGVADRNLLASKGDEVACPGIRVLDSIQIDNQSIAPAIKVFGGVWDALERLLTLDMEDALPLPSHLIFSLISRLLSVDHSTVQKSFKATPNSLFLFGHLAPLHEAAWSMLALLVDVAGSQIFTISESVNSVLKQQLRRLSTGSSAGKMGMEERVRARMYHAIQRCVEQQGVSTVRMLMPDAAASFNLEFAELLYPPKVNENSIRGSDQQKGSKRKSRGAAGSDLLAIDVELAIGRQSQSTDLDASKTQYHSDIGTGINAQMQVMDLLGAMLYAGGAWISGQERHQTEQAIQKVVEEVVKHEALAMAAVKLLLASVFAPCGHRPRLLPLATKIITEGCHHPVLQVRKLCHEAIDELGSFIHPRSALLDTSESLKAGVGDNAHLQDFMAIQLPHMGTHASAEAVEDLDLRMMVQEEEDFPRNVGPSLVNDENEEDLLMPDIHRKPDLPHVAVSHETIDGQTSDHTATKNSDITGLRESSEKDFSKGRVSPLIKVPQRIPQVTLGSRLSSLVGPLQPQTRTGAEEDPKPDKPLLFSQVGLLQQSTFGVKTEQSVGYKETTSPKLVASGVQIREEINLIDTSSESNGRECSDSEGPLPEIDSGGSEEDSDS